MIGVTFAVPEESKDFLKLLADKKQTRADGIEVISGTLDGISIAVLHTGVGRKTCCERITPFLSAHPLTAVISCGFAGGISDQFSVGDLLFAKNFASDELVVRAKKFSDRHNIKVGTLVTLDSVIESVAERADLARETKADAVDMETRFIHEACSARGIPMLSLRAISDTADEPFPAPADVLFDIARQKTHGRILAAYLALHPPKIFALIAFARRITRARQNLTAALRDLITSVR